MALLILVAGGNNSLKVHTVVEICCRSFANGFSSLPAWNVINQWHFCSTGFMLLYWPHFLSLIFPFKVIESWINGRVSDRAHKIGSLTFRRIWLFKSGYLHCAVSSLAILRLITATDFFHSWRFVVACMDVNLGRLLAWNMTLSVIRILKCVPLADIPLKFLVMYTRCTQWLVIIMESNRKAKPRLYRFQKNPFEEIMSLLKWKFKIINKLKIWMNLQVVGNIHSGVSQWKGPTQLEL